MVKKEKNVDEFYNVDSTILHLKQGGLLLSFYVVDSEPPGGV